MNPGRKTQFLVRALTLVFALMISLVGDPAPAAERVTIATPSRGLFEFPVVVAMRKGFFKDEGIDVDKVQMQPAIGVKALMSGDVDYLLAWGSALRAAVTDWSSTSHTNFPRSRSIADQSASTLTAVAPAARIPAKSAGPAVTNPTGNDGCGTTAAPEGSETPSIASTMTSAMKRCGMLQHSL